MKKYLSIVAIVLALPITTLAARNLYEFYTTQGLPLPPVASRVADAMRCGITDYTGSASQNIQLLRCLEDREPVFGAGNPVSATDWTLASSVAVGDTEFTLSHVNDLRSNAIATSSLPLKVYFGVEAENSSNFEIVACPRSGYDQQNKKFSGCTRGLAFSGSSEAQVSANRKAHGAGASFNMTNVGQFFNLFGGIYDINTWENNNIFGNSSGTNPYVQIGTSTAHTARLYFNSPNTGAYIESTSTNQLLLCEGANNCYDPASGGNGLNAANPLTIVGSEIKLKASSTGWFILDGSNNLAGNASSTGGVLANANGIALDESATGEFNWNTVNRFYRSATFSPDFLVGSTASGTALNLLTGGVNNDVSYLNNRASATNTDMIRSYMTDLVESNIFILLDPNVLGTNVGGNGGGGGTNSWYYALWTGEAANGTARVTYDTPSTTDNFFTFARDSSVGFNILHSSSTSQDTFFGMRSLGDQTNFPSNSVLIGDHAAFIVDDGTLYASVANGSTQTKTALSDISILKRNYYRIDFSPTVVKFFVNGVQKTQLTTNLPDSTDNTVGFQIQNIGTGMKKMFLTGDMLFILEPSRD